MKVRRRAPVAADRHLAAAAEDRRGNARAAASHRRARAEQRSRLPPADRAALSAAVAARSWPAPRSNCATWPRPAATCCSGRAALISTTPRRPATSASPAAAARRSRASTGSTRSSARARPASRRIRRTCASRWRRSTPRSMWGSRRRAHDCVRGLPPAARRHAADRHQSAADEIITAIELPAQGFAKNYSYLKIRDRLSYAFALVSVAAALELEGGRIKQARLALGGVAHKPWRDPEAEAALRGQPADAGGLQRGGRRAAARCQGLRAQQLQDRAGASRHRPHPDAGRARHAAIAVHKKIR